MRHEWRTANGRGERAGLRPAPFRRQSWRGLAGSHREERSMADDAMHLVEARAALLVTVLRIAAQRLDDVGYAALRAELLDISAIAEKRSTPEARALVEACETALTDLMLHRPHAR